MPIVGDIVDSKCGKCKDVRRHVIMAIVGNEIVKVQCKTCGSAHKHRPETPEKGPLAPKTPRTPKTPRKTTAGGARKSAAEAAARQEWERLSASVVEAEAAPYDMKASYQAGQSIEHPKFGLGFVLKVIPPNKMEVRFADGVKLMICKL